MKPIHIEFGKLEFGTLFFDPITGHRYRKVSENKAEVEEDSIYQSRINEGYPTQDNFEPNEMVFV